MKKSNPKPNPEFRKNRKRIYFVSKEAQPEEFDPYEMDLITYEKIVGLIKARGLKGKEQIRWFVNHLFPGKPNLFFVFERFHTSYRRIKLIQKRQNLLNEINEKIEDMEENNKFAMMVVSIPKDKKKRKQKEEFSEYREHFEYLDSMIKKIEVMIYLCVSPKRICMELLMKDSRDCPVDLNPIIYERWAEQTEHIDRLKFAVLKSADEHMFASREFLLDWLNPEKHPELDMQHVGIVREVALWESRMAGFLNRKKFGNKVEVIDEGKVVKTIGGRDLKGFLGELDKIADKINHREGEGEVNWEEGEFEDEKESSE